MAKGFLTESTTAIENECAAHTRMFIGCENSERCLDKSFLENIYTGTQTVLLFLATVYCQ